MANQSPPIRFIDVFAGCGGLSLGLSQAGCKGVFAIEKSPLAFETFRHNLIDGKFYTFDWPEWLPKVAMTCEELLSNYKKQLSDLKESVDLIVGGPPCQGFSIAGRRDPSDPRNKMTEQYLLLVEMLLPRFIVIENVAGFNMRFDSIKGLNQLIEDPTYTSYADYISSQLEKLGYKVSRGLVNCADFGVPQNRLRYLMMCELDTSTAQSSSNLFKYLADYRKTFLRKKGLPVKKKITVQESINDLRTKDRALVACMDSTEKRFMEAEYVSPEKISGYLRLMRAHTRGKEPNSRRLARHKKETVKYFKKIQEICRPGHCLSINERKEIGTKKHSITVLHSDRPAPTITTLPDDILHYSEPRILTVRENARIQSFPDWFAFKGKYTTGGKQRRFECPRYTQVGNAVPPLLAEAIGKIIISRIRVPQNYGDEMV